MNGPPCIECDRPTVSNLEGKGWICIRCRLLVTDQPPIEDAPPEPERIKVPALPRRRRSSRR